MTCQERSSVGESTPGSELAVYRGPLSLKVLASTGGMYEDSELEPLGLDPVSRLDLLAARDRRAAETIRRLGEGVDGAHLWIGLVRIGCCPRAMDDTAWKKLSEVSPPGHLMSALLQLLDRHFESDHEAMSILERRASDLAATARCERLVGAGATRVRWLVSRSGTVDAEVSNEQVLRPVGSGLVCPGDRAM